MNVTTRCMGKKLFLAIFIPRKRKSQNSGNHDQERGRSGGRRKGVSRPSAMSDLALSWGAQSELGGWSRGLRLALPDSSKQGHQRKGDASAFLVPAVGGRQAGGQGSPAGKCVESHLKEQALLLPLPLLGDAPSCRSLHFPMESKGVQQEEW